MNLKRLCKVSVVVTVIFLVVGCSKDITSIKYEDSKTDKKVNQETNINKIDTKNKIDKKEKQIDKSILDSNVKNLFTGIWGEKNENASAYYKYREDRIECNLNMYYDCVSKVEKDYENNFVKLYIDSFGENMVGSIETIKFDGNNKIYIKSETKGIGNEEDSTSTYSLERVHDMKTVAQDSIDRCDLEGLNANGMDEFLDLSREEFFELLGIYIYDYNNENLNDNQEEYIKSIMSIDEAHNIIENGIETSEDTKINLRLGRVGSKLGYYVVVLYGDPNSDHYSGRAEFFIDAETKQVGEFMTGLGYFYFK
ncbi:MAG: hypothetical protein RR942_15795 [Romboutsia sp.]